MLIGSLDRISTKKNETNMFRKRQQKEYEKAVMSDAGPSTSFTTPTSRARKHLSPDPPNVLLNPLPSETRLTASTSKNLFPIVAKTLDRYGVSDRAGAAIVSATLQDIGIITEIDTTKVVDRSKIRRSRSKARTTLIKASIDVNECIGIYYDGRKDKTLVSEDNRRKVISEEHISLVREPGSEYIGHISLKTGDARTITQHMTSFMSSKSIGFENILAIGCDGTAVNTGTKAGVIRLLEVKYQRPLQWHICQLHANELTLRHLFEHLDGTTAGPKSFTGPIGKSLHNCELLPIINFHAIKSVLPVVTRSKQDFSTDQLYLLEICQAIEAGVCNENLAKRNPGKICHSRWLTTANRILRLYVASEIPNDNLLTLVNFILKVYAPMWFRIKTEPFCIYGAKHLFETIKLSRYLPEDLKSVIDPVIQRNGFFGHSENILIGMLADERKHIKELALRRILKVRQTFSGHMPIRVFKVPTLNFSAEDYIDLINWKYFTEPPLTKVISTKVIFDAISNIDLIKEHILENFRQMPCHTQATERCVKLVTEACAAVCSSERREGFIRNKLESQRMMPIFNTKKEYRTH